MTSCTGCPAQGVFSKLIIEDGASPHTFDINSYWLDYLSESMQKESRIIGAQGITGVPYRMADRSRDGGYFCKGTVTLNPSPSHFSRLMPYLVGDPVSTVYTPGNCPKVFGMMIYRDLDTWTYMDCRVNSWTLRGRAPQFNENGVPDIMTLQMNIMAVDEAGFYSAVPPTWPNPQPTFPSGIGYTPFIIQDSDGLINIAGAPRQIYEFALSYNNNLEMKSVNSMTANSVCPGMREIRLALRCPWTSANQDLYEQPFTGESATLGFVIENMSTIFNIYNLQVPPESPYVRDKNDVFFQINGIAGGSPTQPELTAQVDAINT